MLDLTGLRDRAGDQVAVLSGGNRQRVNIAIGLLGRQPVLLLDEPSSALDPRQRERVWEFVLSLAAGGTTVVYSTHDIAEAERHAQPRAGAGRRRADLHRRSRRAAGRRGGRDAAAAAPTSRRRSWPS